MARVSRSGVTAETSAPDDVVEQPRAGQPPPVADELRTGDQTDQRRPPRPRSAPADERSSDESVTPGSDALIESADEAAALDAASADEPAAGVTAATEPARTLSDRDRAMLHFERTWWRHAGSKEQAIRETFGLSATHYYRLLNQLLDVPAATEFDPLVVGRLRRLRASRARRRAAR